MALPTYLKIVFIFFMISSHYIKTIIIELRIREINILDPYREIVGHLVRVVLVVGVVLLREVVNLKTNITKLFFNG